MASFRKRKMKMTEPDFFLNRKTTQKKRQRPIFTPKQERKEKGQMLKETEEAAFPKRGKCCWCNWGVRIRHWQGKIMKLKRTEIGNGRETGSTATPAAATPLESQLRSKHYFASNPLTVLRKVKMWPCFHNHTGTPASTQRAHEKLKFGGKQSLNMYE